MKKMNLGFLSFLILCTKFKVYLENCECNNDAISIFGQQKLNVGD